MHPRERGYRNAQRAHDEFFLAQPTNNDVINKFEDFLSQYEHFVSPIKVDINGLNSRSRILLIRQIAQEIAENRRVGTVVKVVYKFGSQWYRCHHKTKNLSVTSQPIDFHLKGIGAYLSKISNDIRRIAETTTNPRMARAIRYSRISGRPIHPFDYLYLYRHQNRYPADLFYDNADYLNRFMLLQDLEVVRRLYRKRGLKGEPLREPTNPYDHLPVGVAIAIVSQRMRRRFSWRTFDNTRLFEVFADPIQWDRNEVPSYSDWVEQSAQRRGDVIKDIIWRLGPQDLSVGGIRQILKNEFGK